MLTAKLVYCVLKLTESQRVYILNTLEKIIKEKIDDLEEQTARQLIDHALNEMIHQKVNKFQRLSFG